MSIFAKDSLKYQCNKIHGTGEAAKSLVAFRQTYYHESSCCSSKLACIVNLMAQVTGGTGLVSLNI